MKSSHATSMLKAQPCPRMPACLRQCNNDSKCGDDGDNKKDNHIQEEIKRLESVGRGRRWQKNKANRNDKVLVSRTPQAVCLAFLSG